MIITSANRDLSVWSNIDESDNEEIMNLAKPMMDASNPSDDIWRKFALPLTPPSSPSRTYGETSEDRRTDIAERLHDVCESLDSTFDLTSYNVSKLAGVLNLRSKLISDCMWSGNNVEIVRTSAYKLISHSKKLYSENEEDLYPTPCPSPLPSVTTESAECPSSSECVDPATVFPFPLTNETHSAQFSDTDEEIDVVTVDSKPIPAIGTKRKLITAVVCARVPPQPLLKKAKSSPVTLPSFERQKSRRASSNSADDSDPESRRATHNVLERKRRIDLKNSFERLRDCVPMFEKQDKAPKVVVLKRAAQHIAKLTQEEIELTEQKILLQKEKKDLINRLKQLLHDGEEIVF
uniref:Myc n=1 Tax=Hydractinia echinata TaxID=3283270 RepID=F6MGA1_HYDEC|nr:Myc [Hydractinia echinata]